MPLDNFAERASDGQPSLEDDEKVFFTQRDVACVADESAGQFDGPGTVFVTTKCVELRARSLGFSPELIVFSAPEMCIG
jgi:hypothetical protein